LLGSLCGVEKNDNIMPAAKAEMRYVLEYKMDGSFSFWKSMQVA
jgi:hypothetical protein